MFAYDVGLLNHILEEILKRNCSPETFTWLEKQKVSVRAGDVSKFNLAFVAMPRRTGKAIADVAPEEIVAIDKARKDFQIKDWGTDRLARTWLLMQLKAEDKDKYVSSVENLFLSAEMSELVALYSSLPVLPYPEAWKKRCAEGIRSNIGQVLEAVICNNPYPSEHLDDAAWNQLVLKAIFTEKPVLEIVGLKKRSNPALAASLSDYAHERWAAHREVNPLLWICVSPFIDQNNFADIQRTFASADPAEREAAALAALESSYEPAQEMVKEYGALVKEIESGRVNWKGVAARMRGDTVEK